MMMEIRDEAKILKPRSTGKKALSLFGIMSRPRALPHVPDVIRRERQEDRHSDPHRTAIIVLGMHRSGTSALTRVLGFCGATLPLHSPFDIHESNPLGHWEPGRIVEAHERFLADCGFSWDEVFDYPAAAFDSPVADLCRERLEAIALREFGQADMFVLKDPRLSRLLPLWRPVLTNLGAAPHAVIAVRNPLNVAASLQRRDGWDEYRALVVWMRYMLAAERDTRHMPRCFVRHEDLVADWRRLIHSIAAQLNLPLSVNDDAAREIDVFVRDDLLHHRRSDAELFERGDIPECVKQVYSCCRAAANGEEFSVAALDAVSEALDAAGRILQQTRPGTDWREGRSGITDIRRHQIRRDALLALSLAELERARNVSEKSQQQLLTVLRTRSWRLTRPFRGASYMVKGVGRLLAGLLP